MHYRYEKAILDGHRVAVAIARVLGVKTKIVVVNLTPEEAAKLNLKTHGTELDLPPGLNK
jgi:hypothetical protein